MTVEETPSPRAHGGPGEELRLSRDESGRLVLETPDGHRHASVEPVRAFPINDPNRWITLCDAEGRELTCLESLEALPADARALIEEELSIREFLPVIRRIVRVHGDAGPMDLEVETDRGPTLLTLESEDDVRILGPHRVLITDARKIRFQIPDTRSLDSSSRRTLERFL